MRRRLGLGAVIAAQIVAAASCGYPSFEFGPGDTAGSGGMTSSSSTGRVTTSSATGGASTSSSTAASTSSSTAASSSSGTGGAPPGCTIDHVVISELRTRGLGGGTDEFVELYNPTDQDLILSHDWTLEGRSQTDFADSTRWTGSGGILHAHGHFLIAGSGYTQSPARDDALSTGISDAGRVRLVHWPDVFTQNTIDSVCFAFDSVSLGLVKFLTCEGEPAQNAHDDTTASNADRSMTRKPRDCTDTDANLADFGPKSPATPMSSQSPPVIY